MKVHHCYVNPRSLGVKLCDCPRQAANCSSYLNFGKGPHGKRCTSHNPEGDGEEPETGPRKRREIAQVLDDEDVFRQEPRVRRTARILGIVHIPKIHAHQPGLGSDQEVDERRREIGSGIPIGVGSPPPVPPGPDEDGPPL